MNLDGPFKLKPLTAMVALANLMAQGSAHAAVAADSAARSGRVIEEVIVTATRRETTVQDVPYNISAVSGTELEAAGIVDNADLMRAIPGVAVVDRGYRNSGVINGIMIRGVNVDGAALGDYSLSAVPTVSTYVNETPLYANFVLRDIERVEVLRGPQGTLYGSGSLGGTVRYIMREPDAERFAARFSATGSNVEGTDDLGWAWDTVVNVPLSETLALRVLGGQMDYPGITDYVNVYRLDDAGLPVAPNGVLDPAAEYRSVKDADDVDIWYGRAALKFEPNDRFSAVLSHQRQSDDIGGRRQQTTGTDGYGRRYRDYENGSVQLEPSSRDVELTALEMELDLGFATLTSSSSFYDHEGDSVSENTGFYAQAGFLAFYYNYPRPMASAVRSYEDEAFVQELRLVSNTEGSFDYVVGLYYQDQDLLSTQQSYLRGFKRWWDTFLPAFADAVTGDKDFDYRREETFEDLAAYGELTWHVTPTVQITGGLRYFDNEFTNRTFMDLPLYASFSDPTDATFEVKDDDVLFKLNGSWDWRENSMLYATVSEGYRRGGANAVPLEGTFAEDPGWQRYDSDSVVNYEVGIKGVGHGVSYAATVFHVDWDDVQVNTATTNWGFFAAANGGEASSRGIEIQLDGHLTDALRFGIGYAYVDAELDEDIFAPDNPVTPRARKGARLPGTPKHSINGSLEHSLMLANGLIWTNRVQGYYQSSTRNAINDTAVFNVELDGFQLWNLSSTLSAEQWAVTGFVRNVFNEEGVTGLFTELYMGTAPDIGYFGNGNKEFISVPRSVGLTVSYDL